MYDPDDYISHNASLHPDHIPNLPHNSGIFSFVVWLTVCLWVVGCGVGNKAGLGIRYATPLTTLIPTID